MKGGTTAEERRHPGHSLFYCSEPLECRRHRRLQIMKDMAERERAARPPITETFGMDPLLFHTLALMVGGTDDVRDRKRASIVLGWASTQNARTYDDVLSYVLRERKAWKAYLARTQRQWQSKVSRRPQRGRNHDSWSTREEYVRCSR